MDRAFASMALGANASARFPKAQMGHGALLVGLTVTLGRQAFSKRDLPYLHKC
jgi:hypothetical protein